MARDEGSSRITHWGMAMSDLSRPERLQIMLSPGELAAIDDWRFTRRMPSRAAAVRELLRRGMTAEGIEIAATGRHSSSFGVLPGRGK